VFDLLYLNGFDLRRASLVDRKAALASLLPARDAILRYSDHVSGSGADFFREACRHGLEGIVSKRAHSTYEGGPRGAWVKTKCTRRQEFVIGGYTEPRGARSGLGALLVGVYDGDALVYSGKVGTGFDHRMLIDLEAKLRRIETSTAPFAAPPHVPRSERVHWVSPRTVAEIEFTEWTGDGMLRHPSFKGLREDKPAREVVREGARQAPRDGKSEARVARKKAVKRAPNRVASGERKPAARRRAARGHEDTVAGVRISHPERVLDLQSGFTKLDLARLFETLEDRMVPHYRGRAMMILRCPEGVAAACFVQKHDERAYAGAVRTVMVPEKDGEKPHLTVTDLASLIGLVQLGGLEFHVWGSRADKVELPDRLIFDLDPDPALGWHAVKQAALELRERFRGMKLESFLRTTGGKGLHVVLPIVRRQGWDVAKEFCRGVAQSMVHDAPDRFTAQMSKARRHGRIFVDWLRNGRGATAVGPYSTRVRPGLPIAAPIGWDELPALEAANVWTVTNLPARIAKLRRDPWEGIDDVRQSLPKLRPRVSVTG
jgi:bifunctional non-homologous end joining protein LigD